MIQTVFYYTSDHHPTGYLAKGHADWNTQLDPSKSISSYDLLCGVVSAILQQTALGMVEILHMNPKMHIEKGYLKCEWEWGTLSEDQKIGIHTLIETNIQFLKRLDGTKNHLSIEIMVP